MHTDTEAEPGKGDNYSIVKIHMVENQQIGNHAKKEKSERKKRGDDAVQSPTYSNAERPITTSNQCE